MKYLGPLIAFIIALAIAFFLILAMQVSSGGPIPPIEETEYNRRLDRLDRNGVEAAYRARVGLLFQNWMTDTNEASKDRALRGHRNARKIYLEVMRGIDARDPEEGFRLQSDTTSPPFTLPAR